MNKELYLKIITDSLATLTHQVEYRNSINLFDINIVAEDFFKEFLNLIYGYDLTNLNIIEKNTSAIDLGDLSKKIAIQVTSDNTSTKIDDTIEKFIEKKLYEKYNRLQILILTRKKSYTKSFETRGLFSFEKSSDIIDCKTILQRIKDKNTDELLLISNFLEKELSTKINEAKRRQANEIDTIIELIEYLSNNKAVSKDKEESITDPNHKINNRFKEYADFLKGLYIELVTLYGEAVEQAKETLGLDEVKNLVIRLYLKDISNDFLDKAENNPRTALDNLTQYFEDQLSISGKKYDKMAIKFYLISETIKCNVFPNKGWEKWIF